jgi:hypothetical protein
LVKKYLILASLLSLAAQANPFDPKAYIDNQEVKKPEPAEEHILLSRGIYKLEGVRYQKFLSNQSAVYLPSPKEIPDLMETAALCPVHIQLLREVLPIREGLAIGKEFKPHEKEILRIIGLCRDGKIRGPSLIVEQADGSLVEVKAKEGKPSGSTQKQETITK